MRFIWLVILCAMIAGAAPPAHAARFNGAYLLQVCDLDSKGHEKVKGGALTCQSYISGVIDYHSVLSSLDIAPRIDICIPEKVSLNELQKIVLEYLRHHSEHDGFIAAPAVTMALYDVYPCKKRK